MAYESIESLRASDSKDIKSFLDPSKIEQGIQLGIFDNVNIKRSSGEIENGWKIIGFDSEPSVVTVCKPEGNSLLRKKISLENLKEWN